MVVHVASPRAPEPNDDGRLAADPRLRRLRSQVAVIRALADEIEVLARPKDADGLSEQIIEEMARLGCRLLEAAASLAEPRRPEDSGVFARLASSDSSARPTPTEDT